MDRTGAAVGLLVDDGFDERELSALSDALGAAGVEVVLVGAVDGRSYTGRHGAATVVSRLAPRAAADRGLAALVIPGGYAADRMRLRHGLVDLVKGSVAEGRPVAAVGHGVQLLISADVLRGRTVTCWPSIAVDVKNAGGLYVDRPVADDRPLLTSRKIDDVPQLVDALLDALDARG